MDDQAILNLFPQSDAVHDVPDDRDFRHSDVFREEFGAVLPAALPRRVVYDFTAAQNQNAKNNPSTIYACVFFTKTHINNEQNFIEWRDNPDLQNIQAFSELSAADQSRIAFEQGLLNLTSGAAIQDGPKLAVKQGLSAGYTLPFTIEEMKLALYMRQFIQIGTGGIDWIKTFRNGDLIIRGKCYNHSMMIEGYDDDLHGGCWILRGSNGEIGFHRGRIFLKYEDTDILFQSRYAYIDKNNQDIVDRYKKNMRVKDAIARGYITDIRMNDIATRLEGSYVVQRVKPGAKGFWNKEHPNNRLSRQEFIWMLESATGRKFPVKIDKPKDYILRSDMAAFSVMI